MLSDLEVTLISTAVTTAAFLIIGVLFIITLDRFDL